MGMLRAFIAHGDFFDDGPMAALVVLGTWIDGVLVVDAAACRVAFNELDTHDIGEDSVSACF